VFWYTFQCFPQKFFEDHTCISTFANFEEKHAINGSKIEKLLGIQFCIHHRACVIFFSLKKSYRRTLFINCRWVRQGRKIVGFKENILEKRYFASSSFQHDR
jgi:hypothetical protein